jgi:biotin synthase
MPETAKNLEFQKQSPEHLRLSLAAAMTLGFAGGRFYRDAKLGCINLLLTYPGGCKANCAFCGLAREKHVDFFDPKFEKFIRVTWKAYALDEVIERTKNAPDWVHRFCISMITHPKAKQDTLYVCDRLVKETGLPVSILCAPTIMNEKDLIDMKEAGADRIGVAIDAATPEIFHNLRGKPAGGPHRWDHYWDIYEKSLAIFGKGYSGVHLIYGLGETEEELINAIDRAKDMGGYTHLFCFYPEVFSAMKDHPQPPATGYRRIQMARWLIDGGMTRASKMTFDDKGRVLDFGVDKETYEKALNSGEPFETSGCPGKDGKVACNRPYGNEKPGPDLRNYPFTLESDDIALVSRQIKEYE